MSLEQKKELDDVQNELDAKLEKTLTAEQRNRIRDTIGFGGFAVPGEFMSKSRQMLLKPTDEQKKQLAELQRAIDAKLDKILTADQRTQFEKMKQDFGRGATSASSPSNVAGGVRAQAAGPNGLGPRGRGDDTSSLPPGVNPVYRAMRYGADFPGLAGKDLRPLE